MSQGQLAKALWLALVPCALLILTEAATAQPGGRGPRSKRAPTTRTTKTKGASAAARPIRLPRSMKKGMRRHAPRQRVANLMSRAKRGVAKLLGRNAKPHIVNATKQRSAADKARVMKLQLARRKRSANPQNSPMNESHKNWKPPTQRPRWPSIPKNYIATSEGSAIVFRKPGSNGKANTIRVMGPRPGYPNGYWVRYNAGGNQAIPNSISKKGDLRQGPRHETHVPLPGPARR